MKKKCFGYMKEAYDNDHPLDIIASNILQTLAPSMAKRRDRYMIEDTFVHLHLHSLFDEVFSTEEIFYESWANSALESSDDMKPDWLVYIRPWNRKIDLTTCEVKPPLKNGSVDYSDFVKLGLELREMLDTMLGIIEDEHAAVFGILVKGYSMSTFKMDKKYGIYRMIELNNCKLVSKQSELVLFPVVLSCILQVKHFAADVARKVTDIELQGSNGKRKLCVESSSTTNSRLPVVKQRRRS
ncbi:unnamed protein product [Absidia cylindrospora]